MPCSAVSKQSSTSRPVAGTWHMMQDHTLFVLASLEASENLGCHDVVVLPHVGLRSVWNKVVGDGLEQRLPALAGAARPGCA